MARRSNNEGSVYQRADGRWVGQITINGIKKYKYSKTKREATAWINNMRQQIEQGITARSMEMKLKEYLAEWLTTESSRLKKRTVIDYGGVIRVHINPALGRYKLSEIDPILVERFYNRKRSQGTSERMLRLIHAILHHALGDAVRKRLLGWNPTDAVTRPRPQAVEYVTWDATQVMSFLSYVESTRYAVLFAIALNTGMRKGELLGLKWQDVDWSNQSLHIRRQVQRFPGEGLLFVDLKTKFSRRSISLGEGSMQKLRDQGQLLDQDRMLAGERWQEHDLLFPNSVGGPQDPSNIASRFKQYSQEAGLPLIRFHDLRHTAASLMMQLGAHPKVVQERLGHSRIATTMDIYSHVSPSMQQEIAQKMDVLLTPTVLEIGKKEEVKRKSE